MDTGRETGGTELATFGLELATFWPNLDTGVKGSFSENDVLVVFSPFVKVDGTVDVLDKVDDVGLRTAPLFLLEGPPFLVLYFRVNNC